MNYYFCEMRGIPFPSCINVLSAFPPSFSAPILSFSLSPRISISTNESKNIKQVFHKAVKKISHVRVVTQLYAPCEEHNVMMSHH